MLDMLKEIRKRYPKWKIREDEKSGVIEISATPVLLSFKRLPMGGYYCELSSIALFNSLVEAYSVDTKNCPPQTFRTDSQFVEDGTFFEWLQKRLSDWNINESRKELAREIELLRKQTETERLSVTSQRRGQETLRNVLLKREDAKCMISGVVQEELLIASHIKPWCECSGLAEECLDLENVLLLAANWDALFDKKFISFDPETGKMIKSERISEEDLIKFGVPKDWHETVQIPVKTERRKNYLSWHLNAMRDKDVSSMNKSS